MTGPNNLKIDDEIIKDNLIPKILNIENSIRIKTY